MTDLPAKRKRTYPLGFGIEGQSLVHNHGAVRPATKQEIAMWNEIERLAAVYAEALRAAAPPLPEPEPGDCEWERPTVL